eukprot:3530528-Pyramimonas_sp.AAC.1
MGRTPPWGFARNTMIVSIMSVSSGLSSQRCRSAERGSSSSTGRRSIQRGWKQSHPSAVFTLNVCSTDLTL